MLSRRILLLLALFCTVQHYQPALAQEVAMEDYCQRAQQIVARTSLLADVVTPDNHEAFVK